MVFPITNFQELTNIREISNLKQALIEIHRLDKKIKYCDHDVKRLLRRLQDLAYANKGLKVYLKLDPRDSENNTFTNTGFVVDLYENSNTYTEDKYRFGVHLKKSESDNICTNENWDSIIAFEWIF